MAEYHVGCGFAGIYAGTLKRNKRDEWLNKSNVTNEAINAVVLYMDGRIKEGETAIAYGFKLPGGKYPIEISSEILQRAVSNTVEMCINAVDVEGEEQE